jgi:single-strand DNA-binding protein
MINQAIIIGNLGRDPELGETAGNKRYARLSVATSDTWKDKATGERKERTEWHRVVVWGDGICGMLANHAKKGTKIFVSGKLATRKWEKDGVERYATEIVVQGGDGQIRLLGDATGGGGVPAPDEEPESRHRSLTYDQSPLP